MSAAWRIRTHYKGPYTAAGIDQNLSLEEVAKPKPQKDQVLVRIHAASLNYRDILIATSDERYAGGAPVDGLVPLADGAGVVAKVSSESSRWKVGDRVFNASNSSWKAGQTQASLDKGTGGGAGSEDGVLQQYAVFDEDSLAPIPSRLSFEEAASLAGAHVSAWNALFGGPKYLKKGDVVVVQGTGGVSIAVLQIAVAVGATVIAFSTSEDKLDVLRGLGATHALSYRDRSDWSRDVIELTGGRGADHVVDVVGAATIAESIRSVRQDGLVSAVGFLSASEKHDLIPDIIWGAKTVRGLLYGSLGMFQEMAAFVEENKIQPVISEVFGWTIAKEAYKRMLKQGFVGKIVIKVD